MMNVVVIRRTAIVTCSIDSGVCSLRLTLEVVPEANGRGKELCREQEPYITTLGKVW